MNPHPFLYYIPGEHDEKTPLCDGGSRIDHAFLAEHGLSETLADITKYPEHVTTDHIRRNGPDGKGGVLLVPNVGGKVPDEFYVPANQEWRDCGKFWIGWTKERLPRPEDLARNKQIRGLFARDPCERMWMIPTARSPHSATGNIPCNITKPNGQVRRVVKQKHRKLWDLGKQVADHMSYGLELINACKIEDVAESEREIARIRDEHPGNFRDDTWLAERCVEILGVNYRIGWPEINAYAEEDAPVLDEDSQHTFASALVDLQAWTEFKKKPTVANGQA